MLAKGPLVFSASVGSPDSSVCFNSKRGAKRLDFPLLFGPMKIVIGRTLTQPESAMLRKLRQRNSKPE
jgi:hypothetical protein